MTHANPARELKALVSHFNKILPPSIRAEHNRLTVELSQAVRELFNTCNEKQRCKFLKTMIGLGLYDKATVSAGCRYFSLRAFHANDEQCLVCGGYLTEATDYNGELCFWCVCNFDFNPKKPLRLANR